MDDMFLEEVEFETISLHRLGYHWRQASNGENYKKLKELTQARHQQAVNFSWLFAGATTCVAVLTILFIYDIVVRVETLTAGLVLTGCLLLATLIVVAAQTIKSWPSRDKMLVEHQQLLKEHKHTQRLPSEETLFKNNLARCAHNWSEAWIRFQKLAKKEDNLKRIMEYRSQAHVPNNEARFYTTIYDELRSVEHRLEDLLKLQEAFRDINNSQDELENLQNKALKLIDRVTYIQKLMSSDVQLADIHELQPSH